MQRPERDPQLLDLRSLLTLLYRRRWSIALVTIVITALALGFVRLRAPVYTSLARVEVRPLTIDEQMQPFASDSFVNMETEAARVTEEAVTRLAAPAIGLDPTSPTALADAVDDVSVTVRVNTTYLDISCTKPSPRTARGCAAAFAAAYIQHRIEGARALYTDTVEAEYLRIQQADERIARLSTELDGLTIDQEAERAIIEAQIDVQNQLIVAAQTNVFSLPTASPDAAVLSRSADFPVQPSNKDYAVTGLLALILGLALGVGLALVRDRLAEHIVAGDELERILEAPILAAVPTLPARTVGRPPALITLVEPESPASHAYRAGAATIAHLAREGSFKVIAVTGPSEGEGKTPATGNLAVALAQSGRHVIAVSCDLRNPSLHRFLDLGNEVGVTDLVLGGVSVGEALQQTETSGLSFIASGPMPDNPTDLLGSEDMGRLLIALRTRFDFVLLDTGPGLVADALFLAPHTDGLIVVADAAKTARGAVAHLRRQLESAGGLIIGGILNNSVTKHAGHPYPYFVRPSPGMRLDPRSVDDHPEGDGGGVPAAGSSTRRPLDREASTSTHPEASRTMQRPRP